MEELTLDLMQEVLRLLDETLSLSGRAIAFKADTELLGSVPELDSMAVVSVITGLEDRFGIVIDDDDIDGQTFATVGSLVEFVKGKVG
jgi:acyl carrier protein